MVKKQRLPMLKANYAQQGSFESWEFTSALAKHRNTCAGHSHLRITRDGVLGAKCYGFDGSKSSRAREVRLEVGATKNKEEGVINLCWSSNNSSRFGGERILPRIQIAQ